MSSPRTTDKTRRPSSERKTDSLCVASEPDRRKSRTSSEMRRSPLERSKSGSRERGSESRGRKSPLERSKSAGREGKSRSQEKHKPELKLIEQPEDNSTNISILPKELLKHCLSLLFHIRSLLSCHLVSKYWLDVSTEINPRIWKIDSRQIILGNLVSWRSCTYEAKYQGFDVTVNVVSKDSPGYKNRSNKLEIYQESAFRRFPNVIIQYGAYFDNKGTMFVVSENAGRGNLSDIFSGGFLSISKALKISCDIAKGLSQLHCNKIVHRNVKMKNILVKTNWTAKICDFTFSLPMDANGQVTTSKFSGTIKYSSPEILRERYSKKPRREYTYSGKVDVYAFAILFWELLSREKAFKRPKEFQGKEGLAKYICDGNRPLLPSNLSNFLKNFFEKCWHEDPDQRPMFEEILKSWNKITLHAEFPDKTGRLIAKKLWSPEKPFASLNEIFEIFSENCFNQELPIQKKSNYLLFFKKILCLGGKSEDKIKQKQFSRLLGWFGPLDKHLECEAFFGRIKDVLSKSFFTEKIQETLISKGKFQVSPSYKKIGEFEICYISKVTSIPHYEYIYNQDGILYISFSSDKETLHRVSNWSDAKSIIKKKLKGAETHDGFRNVLKPRFK